MQRVMKSRQDCAVSYPPVTRMTSSAVVEVWVVGRSTAQTAQQLHTLNLERSGRPPAHGHFAGAYRWSDVHHHASQQDAALPTICDAARMQGSAGSHQAPVRCGGADSSTSPDLAGVGSRFGASRDPIDSPHLRPRPPRAHGVGGNAPTTNVRGAIDVPRRSRVGLKSEIVGRQRAAGLAGVPWGLDGELRIATAARDAVRGSSTTHGDRDCSVAPGGSSALRQVTQTPLPLNVGRPGGQRTLAAVTALAIIAESWSV